MKKIGIQLLCLLLLPAAANAQNDGYILLPGPAKTLAPGAKLVLNLEKINTDGSVSGGTNLDVVKWTVNGHEASSQDPVNGSLDIDLTLSKVIYTAPTAAPAHNPVAIAVTAREPGKKNIAILVCNVTVLNAQYKLTADFTATGPEGINYHFKGECYTNLVALADGTYMLAPVDNSREMDITIEDAAMTSHNTFIGPKAYKIPFLFTINKMDKKNPAPALARLALSTICPMKGKVQWIMHGSQDVTYICDIDHGSISYIPGTTQVLPGVAGHPFAMNGMTNLDILQYFGPSQAEGTSFTNQVNAASLKDFAQRIQAHQGDQAYFRTAQGKADLQKMQSLQKQMGNTMVKNAGEGALLHQAKADAPSNGDSSPKMLPGFARIRVQDMFDPKSAEAFSGTLNASVGPIQANIKVRVERLK